MSVYSGFATRKQQLSYAELAEMLVQALVRRVNKLYLGQACNQEVFVGSLRKIYMSMEELENYKHLSPKFSHILKPLLSTLNINTVKEPSKKLNKSLSRISPEKSPYEMQKTEMVQRRRIFSSRKSQQSLEYATIRNKTSTISDLLESQKMISQNGKSRQFISTKKIEQSEPLEKQKHRSSSAQSKLLRDLTKTYDKIINTVVNTKTFKRKRYELKKEEGDRFQSIK